MSKNLLVINVEHGETRIALIENGIIAELRTERTRGRTTVGNVYLGKVTRVLPGMQAAFVEIGQDRAAFLHVEDLIRPNDFEQYITGGLQNREHRRANCCKDDRALDDDEAMAADPAVGASQDGEEEHDEQRVRSSCCDESSSNEPNDSAPRTPDPRLGRRRSANRERPEQAPPPAHQQSLSRVSRETPIREVIREGQEIIVQVVKDPIGTKGSRVSSHISLPGRYVVYMPTVDHVGVSRRIGSDVERQRLRAVIESMRPPKGGLIVRTVAQGLTKKQLKADIGFVVRLWGEIVRKRETHPKPPCCLSAELDIVLRTVRDQFSDDVDSIVIDDRARYDELRRFVSTFMPDRIDCVELYEGSEPIFDAYGIEDEISRALARKIPLRSGGYLVIDQAEALTAIDVNTGRFVGKGSKDVEETILKTNLEAVEEIAYQLRFRDLGGLIVLDMIDMERPADREIVRHRLEELLKKDKANTSINPVSDLGLIEMTRKRTRESLGKLLYEPCFYCDGTGQLQSRTTIALEILRQIRREYRLLSSYQVVVNANPAVVEVLNTEEKESLIATEKRLERRIELVPRREYHMEQFDLQGK
ncbi:MAG: Rne/Rng family ribonuclease [Polyangiaceae bacterium]|nr:Rne/Rng family ribonuclease [Polyangiaceae bacterium]